VPIRSGDGEQSFTLRPDRLVNTDHIPEKLTKVNWALMGRLGFVLPGAFVGAQLIERFLSRPRLWFEKAQPAFGNAKPRPAV
jgi:hypothetical protein